MHNTQSNGEVADMRWEGGRESSQPIRALNALLATPTSQLQARRSIGGDHDGILYYSGLLYAYLALLCMIISSPTK
jgi:ubiquinone biosynthesis protein COQ9